MPGMPMPVRLYRVAAGLIAPMAYRRIATRLGAQGVAPARRRERMGYATAARPPGRVIWFHAASVGESVSVLRLIERLGARLPDAGFVITSGTATSARVVAERLPPRAIHQFAPLDTRPALHRFLAHWRPDAAVFVESELWPQMLIETRALGVPMALVNARLSEASMRGWKRFAPTARYVMGHFTLIHCQDARTEAHLRDLGLTQAQKGTNLKALAGPLPHDADDLQHMRAQIGDRPLWLASSTHPGEDEIAVAAHRAALAADPRTLMILVPRHPERADTIESLVARAGMVQARRSRGDEIGAGTEIYLADTLGETGLWYALAPLTCLCGSFAPVGGHNPYEPAHAGSAVLHGPHYANFAETYAEMDGAGAAREVADEAALAQAVPALLADDRALTAMRDAARIFAAHQQDVLADLTGTLCAALALHPLSEAPVLCPN